MGIRQGNKIEKKYENKKNFYDNLNVVRKTTKTGAVQ